MSTLCSGELKMQCKSFSHFFNKKYWCILDINVWNFNKTLTNNVVSFEPLGPGPPVHYCNKTSLTFPIISPAHVQSIWNGLSATVRFLLKQKSTCIRCMSYDRNANTCIWFKSIYFDFLQHVYIDITTCNFLRLEQKHIAYLVFLLIHVFGWVMVL